VKRREFLIIPAGALAAPWLQSLARSSAGLAVESGGVRLPLRFFTGAEARVVIAACECIFPADESGPGATEAGVVVYIDRQLAGPYGRDGHRYTKGPFVESVPQHGYQGRETPRQVYRAGIRALGDFTGLSAQQQIAALRAIQTTRFFELLRTHTIEGVFCDPMHGGNAGLVGWKMIGFPGPQMDYSAHIDRHYGTAWRPPPASLQQITGRRARPSEDEAPESSL
jgi:gluconate 2-dehydrogenase gamma chain